MNLLTNPEFDQGTYEPKGQMGLVLPIGWRAGCLDNGKILSFSPIGAVSLGTFNKLGPRARPNMSPCLKPEVLQITAVPPYLDPPRTDGTGNSVTIFKLYGTMCAWLYQQVTVVPGKRHRLSFRAHAWARDNADPNDAHYSHGIGTGAFYSEEGSPGLNDNQINFRFRVGISEAANPLVSATWGRGAHIYNVFHGAPSLEFVSPTATQVYIFLCVDNLWGFVNSNAFMAHPILEEVGDAPTPPQVDLEKRVAELESATENILTHMSAMGAELENHEARLRVLEGETSPPPPTPPKRSKLGAHVLRMNDGTAQFINAGPSVVKLAGDWGYAPSVPAGVFVLGRQVADFDAQEQYNRGASPKDAASKLVNTQINTYRSNSIIYWEGHNEPAWWDRASMAWYAQFEIERMKLMDALGYKCVIGNFSTGVPQVIKEQNELWTPFLPACKYALENGHVLGLHEYSGGWLWWLTGAYQDPTGDCKTSDGKMAGWLTLRYRLAYDQYLKPDGLGALKLVITEAGLDPGVTSPPGCPGGAWRSPALQKWWRQSRSAAMPDGVVYRDNPAQFYAEQLKWYDRELQKDDFVIGATIFTFGNMGGDWAAFDVTEGGCSQVLSEYIRS